MRKVYFRADGNSKIGLGHLVRCLALAQMLQKEFGIVFAAKEIPESVRSEIEALSFGFIRIETESDFLEQIAQSSIVVLDHYEIPEFFQIAIKNRGCKLVCIDDLHEKTFYADLIINHAPSVKQSDYKAQTYTKFALGLDYVLLRPVFLEKAQEQLTLPSTQTVFVCFGGSDSRNITLRVIEILKTDLRFNKIIIVVGDAYMYTSSLENSTKHDNRFRVHYSVSAKEMVDLIMISKLCIVPASGILQEAIALGRDIISGIYIENQRSIFENFKALSAFESAEGFSNNNIIKAIDGYFNKDFNHPKKFIDGNSNKRLLQLFNNL